MAQLGNAGPAASAEKKHGAGGRLANRVALVTGASRGLGRFFAETLAREGAHVILGNRSDAPELREAIAGAGGRANFAAMDVTRDDSIVRAFECRRRPQNHQPVDVRFADGAANPLGISGPIL
jgi:NAD(P)-dependent dehydrogenase (short-subunit alcohol dehydrogenase family)